MKTNQDKIKELRTNAHLKAELIRMQNRHAMLALKHRLDEQLRALHSTIAPKADLGDTDDLGDHSELA